MYDEFRAALDHLQKLSDKDRSYATTWLVVWCVLLIFRYAITGAVVFLLGRRIITAFAVALKESQRKAESR